MAEGARIATKQLWGRRGKFLVSRLGLPVRLEIRDCSWAWTAWSVNNGIENGDIPADKRPTYDQVVDVKLGEEALKAAGGATKIGSCAD